jgi:hypothetical protein
MTYAQRVREAVDDEEWQTFRKSLKGMDTASKLNNLRSWYFDRPHIRANYEEHRTSDACDVCVQVDNYLKALARGGQLPAGVSLDWAIASDWNLRIKK